MWWTMVEEDRQEECIILVMIEMISAVIGIFMNLMVFSSVRNLDYLQESTSNLLLTNICFSNILISFLVKPISAIYVSYALSTGEWHVGLAFCTLYTLTYRTTWLAFPFSVVSLCWNSLHTHCSKITCFRSYHNQHGHVAHMGGSLDEEGSVAEDADGELQDAKRTMAFPTIKQKAILAGIWFISILYGLMACFPEKVLSSIIILVSLLKILNFKYAAYYPSHIKHDFIHFNPNLSWCKRIFVKMLATFCVLLLIAIMLPICLIDLFIWEENMHWVQPIFYDWLHI